MSNIVFMGTPQFAVPILKKVNQKYKIKCVFTQPPSKSNRGQIFTKSPIHTCAEELNLEIKTPKKIDEEFEYLKELNLDLVIVVAYGQLISKKILDLSKKGFLNIHASLLPKWRGAAPIQRSILNNEKKTGISFMKIDEKLDSGPVCNKYSIDILDQDNAEILSEKLSYLSTEKILENVQKVLDGEAIFKKPFLLKLRIFFEINCPYATTITRSKFNSLRNSYSSSIFFGVLISKLSSSAHV